VLAKWNNESHATKLVLLSIVSNVLDRLGYRSIGSPCTDLASLLILAPLLTQYFGAQHMVDASCGDPDGESNSRFINASYAWIVLGLALWVLVYLGTFFPD